jgi:hypothetical protein
LPFWYAAVHLAEIALLLARGLAFRAVEIEPLASARWYRTRCRARRSHASRQTQRVVIALRAPWCGLALS